MLVPSGGIDTLVDGRLKSTVSTTGAISSRTDLIRDLRAAGDPLHLMAAEALVASSALAERLQERVHQLEAIARLND